MKIFAMIGSLFDRLSLIVGAFLGSQIPSFMLQYQQHLSGKVDALHQLMVQLYQMASLSQKSLELYIQKFKENPDPDFVRQGEFMEGIVEQFNNLQLAFTHLQESSFWLRPFYFIKDFQSDIGRSTYASFEPGYNLTIEGLCYTFLGMFFGWILYRAILNIFAASWKGIRSIFKRNPH